MEYNNSIWSELSLEVFAHILETCSVTTVIGLTSVCKIWRDNLLNENIWKEIYQRNFMVIKNEPSTLKTFRDRAIKSEIVTTNMAKNRYLTRLKYILSAGITQTISLSKDKALITCANSPSTTPSLLDLNSLKTSNIVAKCKNMAITKDYYIYFVSTHPAGLGSNLTTGQKIDFQHRSKMTQLMQSILLPIDNRKLLTVSLNTDLEENSFVAWSNTLQKLFWIDPVSNTFKIIPLLGKINEVRIDGKYISYFVQNKSVTHVFDWKLQEYLAPIEHEFHLYSCMIYREHLFVNDSDGWHIRTLDTRKVIKRCRYTFEDIPPLSINYYNGIVVLQAERFHLFFNGCTAELLCELKFDTCPLWAPKLMGLGYGKFLIWSTSSMFLFDFETTQ